MKIAIVGSRNFKNLDLVRSYVSTLPKETVIVSGGAMGVDRTSVEAAIQNGLYYIEFLPDWNKYGKRAGYLRNIKIVNESDLVVAFWDGISKGTKISINLAKGKKPLMVFND